MPLLCPHTHQWGRDMFVPISRVGRGPPQGSEGWSVPLTMGLHSVLEGKALPFVGTYRPQKSLPFVALGTWEFALPLGYGWPTLSLEGGKDLLKALQLGRKRLMPQHLEPDAVEDPWPRSVWRRRHGCPVGPTRSRWSARVESHLPPLSSLAALPVLPRHRESHPT